MWQMPRCRCRACRTQWPAACRQEAGGGLGISSAYKLSQAREHAAYGWAAGSQLRTRLVHLCAVDKTIAPCQPQRRRSLRQPVSQRVRPHHQQRRQRGRVGGQQREHARHVVCTTTAHQGAGIVISGIARVCNLPTTATSSISLINTSPQQDSCRRFTCMPVRHPQAAEAGNLAQRAGSAVGAA